MDMIPNHNGDLSLVPGNEGQYCPDNPEYCDKCDYLICCTNAGCLCDQCFRENGACKIEARQLA